MASAPALKKSCGLNMFDNLRRHPADALLFDDAMTELSMIWSATIARAYDFGRWGSLMDVGGGNGLLLATILVLLRFRKMPEPIVVLAAAMVGLIVYPMLHP